MSDLSQLLLKRVQSQGRKHVRRERLITVFDESALPNMQEVGDWSVSGTEQWSREELSGLQATKASELGEIFAAISDPWIHMAAVAELVMHQEDTKAKEFTQRLLELSPDAEEQLTRYFGPEIMGILKAKS